MLDIYPASEWPMVAPIWAELACDSPYASFFLSAEWTGSWLEIFGKLLSPQILVFRSEQQVIGICILVSRTFSKGLFKIRRIYLNTSGEDEAEATTFEFNNLLCRVGSEETVAKSLATHLQTVPWDEFHANGFCVGRILEILESELFRGLIREDVVERTFYVNLTSLRNSGIRYENALSAKTRSNLKRYCRKYEQQFGPVTLQAAGNVAEALEMFEQLIHLHQKTWTARGKSGAFAASRKMNFHQSLIRHAFSKGFIQLLLVKSGTKVIGIVYSFVWSGKISFLQSGFNYEVDKQMSPGMVSFSRIIPYCIDQGLHEWDFLAGENQYKEFLSTGFRRLVWIRAKKSTLKNRAIDWLRSLKRAFASVASRNAWGATLSVRR